MTRLHFESRLSELAGIQSSSSAELPNESFRFPQSTSPAWLKRETWWHVTSAYICQRGEILCDSESSVLRKELNDSRGGSENLSDFERCVSSHVVSTDLKHSPCNPFSTWGKTDRLRNTFLHINPKESVFATFFPDSWSIRSNPNLFQSRVSCSLSQQTLGGGKKNQGSLSQAIWTKNHSCSH